MKQHNAQNIIFDLGGVIINLNIQKTFEKFSQLFKTEIDQAIFADHDTYAFFREYEVGAIDDATFRNHIKSLSSHPISDEQLDEAWNAMLLDIPKDRIEWIYQASQQYNCVILSNTNSIHVRHFEEFFNETTPYGYPGDVFQQVFYSHEIGERKPDREAFEHVLEKTSFIAEETVLFDDLPENLQAASTLGIKTELVERNKLRKEQLLNGRG